MHAVQTASNCTEYWWDQMGGVDLGIFAHNEERNIQTVIKDILHQDLVHDVRHSLRILVLANGCSDHTVSAAQAAVRAANTGVTIDVIDLKQGGKSRTWNEFVHELSRSDAGFLIFADADIRLPDPTTLSRLLAFIEERPSIDAASSRPVKDIDFFPQRLSLTEKLISAGGGTLGDTRHAICGQLYVMRAETARVLHVPIGLPVEDGFVRHALITDTFSAPIKLEAVDQSEDIFHIYGSERHIMSLVRHQVRIVIGGAVNAALFEHLLGISLRNGKQSTRIELSQAAVDPNWLTRVLTSRLPDRRFGWIPWRFLFSRLTNYTRVANFSMKRTAVTVLGFLFDLTVYVVAHVKMARGRGAGYW